MSYATRNIDVEPAITDLRSRTLSRLPGDFSRLVYLASSRDLNTGHYSHDGLAFHFSENVVSKAMAACHQEIFDRLVYASLKELIEELRNYISSTDERPEDFLNSWKHLGSYRSPFLRSAMSLRLRFSYPMSRWLWRSYRHARRCFLRTNNPHSDTGHSADDFCFPRIRKVSKAGA